MFFMKDKLQQKFVKSKNHELMEELIYLNNEKRNTCIFISKACLFEFIKYGHFIFPNNRIKKLDIGDNYIEGREIIFFNM